MHFPEYEQYDALGLAELVQTSQVSALELVEACIDRIERHNPRLNAIVEPLYRKARERAKTELKGSFAGVPFLLKDLIQNYEGTSLRSGCRFYKDYVSTHNGVLVERYLRAGLIFVAKTNTPEFGLLPVTEPELFGPTQNPWKMGITVGGSSGGSAAAVAAGIVPAAHGGDGGGSIRIPASCCGIFGLKPTRARTPQGPESSEAWNGFAIEHVVSRTVRDSAALLDATHGAVPEAIYYAPPVERPFLDEVSREPGKLRIAFHASPALAHDVHPDCVAAVYDAAKLCESLGHDVEEVLPGHDVPRLARAFFDVVCAQTTQEIREAELIVGRKPRPADFESGTFLLKLLGERLAGADYVAAIKSLQAEGRRLARHYAKYDVVLTPTLGTPPGPHGELRPKGFEAALHKTIARLELGAAFRLPGIVQQAAERTFAFIPFTPLQNFTGQPAMSVPLYWNRSKLPIGVMFSGKFGDEATLFRLAGQLENARPWGLAKSES